MKTRGHIFCKELNTYRADCDFDTPVGLFDKIAP